VIGDLRGRRSSVLASGIQAGVYDVAAAVPLANMFKYVDSLRSLSQGRPSFTMRFERYAPMPKAFRRR
jgi:elongation factor G